MEHLPNSTDLEHLMRKLRQGTPLNPQNLALVEKATQSLSGYSRTNSEIANAVNQVWNLIRHQGASFWQTIGFLLLSEHPGTRAMALSCLSYQVGQNGQSLPAETRIQIASFLYELQERVVLQQAGNPACLRVAVAEALSSVLLTGPVLFQNYLDSMTASVQELSNSKLEFLFGVLERFIGGVGLSSCCPRTGQERSLLMQALQQATRRIIDIACYCLRSPQRAPVLPNCLTFLVQIIPLVSSFQVFNSRLIELVLAMLGDSRFRNQAVAVFKAIFQASDTTPNQGYQSKIAERLSSLIEILLGWDQEPQPRSSDRKHKGGSFNQSESTETSFFSRSTERPNHRQPLEPLDSLELLRTFLGRYVPRLGTQSPFFTDQPGSWLASPELRQWFTERCRSMAAFLVAFGERMPSTTYEKLSRQLQVEMWVFESVQLMIELVLRLRLPFQRLGSDFFKMVVMKLTPLDPPTRKFYTGRSCIVGDYRQLKLDEVRSCSEDIIVKYRAIMAKVMTSADGSEAYATTIYSLLNSITDEIEQISPSRIQGAGKILETANRIVWSIVTITEHGTNLKGLEVDRISAGLIGSCRKLEVAAVKRGLALNAQLLWVCCPHHLSGAILSSGAPEPLWEFHLCVFSRIVLNPKFTLELVNIHPKDVVSKTQLLLTWVCHLAQNGDYSPGFQQIYPALVKFMVCLSKKNADDPTFLINPRWKDLMKQWIEKLVYQPVSRLIAEVGQLYQEQRDHTGSLKRLNARLDFLRTVTDYLLLNFHQGQAYADKNSHGFLKYHGKKIIENFLEHLETLFTHLSTNLPRQDSSSQSFEAEQICCYRSRFHQLTIRVIQTEMAATDLAKIQTDPRRIRLKSIVCFARVEKLLSQDFQKQSNFKSPEYPSLAMQWILLVESLEPHRLLEVIGSKLQLLCCVGDPLESYHNLLFEKKLEFLGEIADRFALDLDVDGLQRISDPFVRVQSYWSPPYKSLSVEIVSRLFGAVQRGGSKLRCSAMWEHANGFVRSTFLCYLNSGFEDEEFCSQLSRLIFKQIVVLCTSKEALYPGQESQDNRILLEIDVREYVMARLPLRNPEQFRPQNQRFIRELFRTDSLEEFLRLLHDYKVIVTRQLVLNSSCTTT